MIMAEGRFMVSSQETAIMKLDADSGATGQKILITNADGTERKE